MHGGWGWRKKGAALQAGNGILEENSLKQAIHGIFPSPQVSGFHLNRKQGNKDKCQVGLPLEDRAPGWSRWKESVSNALEGILVNKGIPGSSLRILSGYFHLFPSRAFEFHKLVSKISVPPRIWQRKGKKSTARKTFVIKLCFVYTYKADKTETRIPSRAQHSAMAGGAHTPSSTPFAAFGTCSLSQGVFFPWL